MDEIIQKIVPALVGAVLVVAGTIFVNRLQNSRRDAGIIAQTLGMLDVFDAHLRAEDGLNPLSKERLLGLGDLFTAAYSVDTSVALKARHCDIPAFYDAISVLRVQCEQLAN